MSGFAFNGVILVLGLAAIVMLVVGMLLWSRRRRAKSGEHDQSQDQQLIREQIIWRAVAQGGKITVAEAVTHGGQPPMEVERVLMTLVAEGRARAEAGENGEIVYFVDSSTGTHD